MVDHLATRDRSLQRLPVAQITHVDLRAGQLAHPGGVAREHPHRLAAFEEDARQVPA